MRVINFFGGAGAGKSTAAAGLFYQMKRRYIQAELVTEYAKGLVLAGNAHMLSQQNLVFANQEHMIHRLRDKVDFAVTDSPLLLSAYYAPESYPISFKQSVFDFFNTYDNINIFVRRTHPYDPEGRVQSEEESDSVAETMQEFLLDNGIPYYVVDAGDASPQYLLYWLAEQGLLELGPHAKPFTEEDHPPEGWIQPAYQRRFDAQGRPIAMADAVAQRFIKSGVRTAGAAQETKASQRPVRLEHTAESARHRAED